MLAISSNIGMGYGMPTVVIKRTVEYDKEE